jgi:hypothetical protein
MGGGNKNKQKKIHATKRVHEKAMGGCRKEEWEARMLVARLREVHKEGRY